MAIVSPEAVRAGDIAIAQAMVTATARHHNMYFAAEMTVLINAIAAASVALSASTFTPKRIITDGDMVVMHSHVTHQSGDAGMAIFHILRFEGDLIAELWDVGQAISADSSDQAGMFERIRWYNRLIPIYK